MFDWLKRRAAKDLAPDFPLTERWVVLDLETTGLDPQRDRIVEIGAVAVVNGAISLSDSFARIIADSGNVSAANRVIHGVSASEQHAGSAINSALDSLVEWMQNAPLVGFYTPFDIAFLQRAFRANDDPQQSKSFGKRYLDLAVIAPLVFPKLPAKNLAEWSAALELPIRKQHRAVADALTTAHLLQRILCVAPTPTFDGLQAMQTGRRWLN